MRNDLADTATLPNECDDHGSHLGLVCPACYAIQQERVERESLEPRYANTAPNLRKRILAILAEGNGNGGHGH